MFPNALICVSSFITITGTLSALIVPCEQSYPQMNASCKGTQNTRLCNIHHAQLEPILWATSEYGGLFFSVYGMWLCAREHLFPMTNNSFSHLFISALWKKTAWNKPQKKKRLFIPSSQHLAGSNESISLQSLVACHFPWFQHKPDFISLVEMRDLVYSSCKIPPIGSRRLGKDLYWHLGPSQHGRCVRGLTPTVLHEQKSPPVFRGAEVFRCYYGTFQHGNRRS